MKKQAKAMLAWFEAAMGQGTFLLENESGVEELVSNLELPEYVALRDAMSEPRTFQDLEELFPWADMEVERDGEIIIRTCMSKNKDGTLSDMD